MIYKTLIKTGNYEYKVDKTVKEILSLNSDTTFFKMNTQERRYVGDGNGVFESFSWQESSKEKVFNVKLIELMQELV